MEPIPNGPEGTGMGASANGNATKWAIGNYAANYYVFGNPAAGDVQGSTRFPDGIPDGTSNVVFFAERYGTCGTSGNVDGSSTYSSLWGNATSAWRPVFCVNNISKSPAAAGYPGCGMFQVRPHPTQECQNGVAQGMHFGSIMVCMGDGSSRFVTTSVSPATWDQACDPRDGGSLGKDW